MEQSVCTELWPVLHCGSAEGQEGGPLKEVRLRAGRGCCCHAASLSLRQRPRGHEDELRSGEQDGQQDVKARFCVNICERIGGKERDVGSSVESPQSPHDAPRLPGLVSVRHGRAKCD
ncbi:hypothetical protein MHYP_G00162620 [Metynnis hypsauchen]